MSELHIEDFDVLIVSILVLAAGHQLTGRVGFLQRYSIPQAVTGGLLCSILVAAIDWIWGLSITFDLRLRDLLLLVFFSTVGLSAKFSRLKEGGRAFVLLVACAGVFLILQDVAGVLLMMAIGRHPAYGVIGGSVSFAGGHGTAIAWGQVAEQAGLEGAESLGIACATFGLIAGGLIGGPLGERIIRRSRLVTPRSRQDAESSADPGHPASEPSILQPVTLRRVLVALLIFAVCVQLGDLINRSLAGQNVLLPGFLTAMLVGILITNVADRTGHTLDHRAFEKTGEVCLQLFLSMSLMSLQLVAMVNAIGTIFLILVVQVTVMTVFAILIIFRIMGRDYDAAVIASGFTGLGLGATPVAIANMNALTAKHGDSFKAFLIVPLVGAFFLDLMNAVVIKGFAALPLIRNAPLH